MLYHPYRVGQILKRRDDAFPECGFVVTNAVSRECGRKKFDCEQYRVVHYRDVWGKGQNAPVEVQWHILPVSGAMPEMCEAVCQWCGKNRSYHLGKKLSCLFAPTYYTEAYMPMEVVNALGYSRHHYNNTNWYDKAPTDLEKRIMLRILQPEKRKW